MTRFQAVALTLAILAITLFFRAIFFLHDSPTYFEIATFDLIQLSPFSYLTSKEIGLVPPLYYFPAKFLAICGSEPWLPRIFSFLMGLLTPYAAYLAVMRAFDSPRLAWSTALLLALNPLHVIASCSMTPDAMAILMTYLVISAFPHGNGSPDGLVALLRGGFDAVAHPRRSALGYRGTLCLPPRLCPHATGRGD